MATFASDTFTGTPGAVLIGTTPTVGGVWTNGGGSASCPIFTGGGTAVKEASGLTGQCYVNTAPPSADYSVQVDVTPDVGGSDSASGVIGRKASGATNTFYLADYYDPVTAGSRQFRLYKFVAGTPTSLGSYTTNIGTSTTTLKLTMVGTSPTSLTVYVNGVSRITATDSDITSAGFAGVRQGNASDPTTKAIFLDNFSAFDSAASPAFQRRRPSGLYTR